jgi:hypothetical protein
MAVAGLHVVCGLPAEPYGFSEPMVVLPLLEAAAAWSETLGSPSTTAKVAPVGRNYRPPVFSIRSSIDAWVATGAAPNATTGPRRYIPANTDYDLIVRPGDRLAWVAA